MTAPVVEMRSITKAYAETLANDAISIKVGHGEVLGLLGENGAGKSTLMKVLYGLTRSDSGEILLNGRPVDIDGPAAAIRAGVGMVTQHFSLVTTMSVVDNIVLTDRKGQLVDRSATAERIINLAESLGFEMDPHLAVEELGVGERQRVEILKALYHSCDVLILDEPTAVLRPQEVDALFAVIGRLVAEGTSVVMISHKLDEVRRVCDRVTVLRHGRMVADTPVESVSDTELAELMVGRVVAEPAQRADLEQGAVILELDGLSAIGPEGEPVLRGVDLSVREGEVLGIAGVAGNGQRELMEILHGTRRCTGGRMVVSGHDVTNGSPRSMLNAGMGRIPEDRHGAVVVGASVAVNLFLEHLGDFSVRGRFDNRSLIAAAEELIDEYGIKARPEDLIDSLSGGNLQKVILARVLSRSPSVIAVAQPTRGLDIGSTRYVRGEIVAQRDAGAAVVVETQDLSEILELSDRIMVMSRGEVMGTVAAASTSATELGLMMAGRT